jgi:4-amino-4-deoxy-L-arabinose transferase-like glycosyltransferase
MRFAPLALAALCAAVLFTGLGRIGFIDEREARDAEIARELIDHREVLTPLYAREPRFEKPVLGYALEAVGHWLSPTSPRAARVARAIAAVALALLTASIGARHFGVRAGWCAAAVLVTTLGVPLAMHTDGTQVLGTLLAWVGCAGFADAVFGRPEGRDLRLVAAYGALGATLVIAGPLPALWPLGGLALYLRLAHPDGGWRMLRPVAGLAIVVGFALPWYGAMLGIHGGSFAAHAPFFPYGTQPRGAWYAGVPLAMGFLVVGGFPWTALLPGAALHAATWWRRSARVGAGAALAPDPLTRERREEGAAHFFIACLAAALAPIAIYPSPPLTAILPALPAAALLCGRFADHLLETPDRLRAPLANACRMLALMGTVGAIQCVVLAPRLHEGGPSLRLLAAVLLLASWAPLLADLIRRRRAAIALMALPVAVGVPIATLQLLPALEDYLNTRSVAEAMTIASPRRAPLVLVEPAPPSLRVYVRRNLVTADALRPALTAFRAADSLTYLAFRPAREQEVARRVGVPLEILMRTPSLVLARVRP